MQSELAVVTDETTALGGPCCVFLPESCKEVRHFPCAIANIPLHTMPSEKVCYREVPRLLFSSERTSSSAIPPRSFSQKCVGYPA